MRKLFLLLLLTGCVSTTGISRHDPVVPVITCEQLTDGYSCEAIDYAKDGFNTKGESYLPGKVIIRFVIPDITKGAIMEYYKRKYHQPAQKQYEIIVVGEKGN